MSDTELTAAARQLDAFAAAHGFEAEPALYITGEVRIPLHNGETLYSDAAHLYCAACADRFLKMVVTLKGPEAERDHPICPTDPGTGEDVPAHCVTCGETLDHSLTREGCAGEIVHYEDTPSADISPQEAFAIARVLDAAIWDDGLSTRGLTLARAALAHIACGRVRS